MSVQSLNLLVFRDGKRLVCGKSLKSVLGRQIQLLCSHFETSRALDALLLSGELESALADCDAEPQKFCTVTDSLAEALFNSGVPSDAKELPAILDATYVPEKLTLGVPEGFAYYALHPLAFGDVLDHIPLRSSRVAVVGIRTIGATLSAVTTAALRKRGFSAQRITVRPAGHPYNRRTQLAPWQAEFVKKQLAAGAEFLVVDEGPGLSGSSFLSVAEALARAGVPIDAITLVCSHEPDLDRLCAENARQRGQRLRWVAVPQEARRPREAQVWIGGGEWRRHFIPQDSSWPASWLNLERLKYLSAVNTAPRFYKFVGLGHYGNEVHGREAQAATAGFAVPSRMESHGFASYPLIKGHPLSAADISEGVLARLAAYCSFRAQNFSAETAEPSALQLMAEHNLQQLRLDVPVALQLERPVIADGRMQPHEWLLTGAGQMLKTDSGSHGDDHFFPGAVDIAWDLAGVIVEWQMDPAAVKVFLEIYRRGSGDNVGNRIAGYITAYAVFRCAYCLMAANAVQGSEEKGRLEDAAAFYRARLPNCTDGAKHRLWGEAPSPSSDDPMHRRPDDPIAHAIKTDNS